MTYKFQLAEEIREPLHALIAIAGPSGCGKTFSACTIAEALSDGKPFAMIDTEAGRARHFQKRFNFAHCDFGPADEKGNVVGYSVDRYAEVIHDAEAKGFDVIVVDSFSHSWEGIGGVLERQDEVLTEIAGSDPQQREKMNFAAWNKVKPPYRKLLHTIIQCRAHVILCLRAKERIELFRRGQKTYLGKSKIRREDLAFDVVADKDLTYEMTCSFMLTPDRVGVPIPVKLPDELMRAFPVDRPIGPEAGKLLREWSLSGGGSGTEDKKLVDKARAEAAKGFKAVNAFWKGLDDGERAIIKPILPQLKRISDEAEAVDDDIPFGNPDDGYEEHQKRAAAEAEAAHGVEGKERSDAHE